MENIRLKKITVVPSQSPLVIHNGNVHFFDTSISSSILNGSIIANGGVSINCTYNATSASAGGALTIGGGMGVGNDIHIGKNLTLESMDGILKVNGITKNRMYLDSVLNKEFYISLDGVNTKMLLQDNNMVLYITNGSTNATSGALIVRGGVSIGGADNALSITQGGGLTVVGGIATEKDMYIGGNTRVNGFVSTSSVMSSNATMGSIYIDSLRVNNGVTATFNSHTIGSIFTTGGNVGIGTTSPSERLHVAGNVVIGGSTIENFISFAGTSGDVGGTTTYIGERIYSPTEKSELLLFKGNDASSPIDGPDRIRLLAAEHRFETFTATLQGTFEGVGVSGGTARMTINPNGNVGIGTTSPSRLLTVNGVIESTEVFAQSGSIGSISLTNTTIVNVVITSVTSSNSLLTNQTCSNAVIANLTGTTATIGNVNVTNFLAANVTTSTLVATSLSSGSARIQSAVVSGGSFNATFNTNTIGNIYTTGGNVGIGNVSPAAVLDITGTLNCSNTATFTGNIASSNSSTASVVLTRGGLSINISTNSSSTSNGGALTVAGGCAIARDMYVSGVAYITNTSSSSSSTTGALVVSGGIAVNSQTNSIDSSNGGALTVAGGASVVRDMYVGGRFVCSSRGSINDLVVTSTEVSSGASTGALVCNGGMSMRGTVNSSSITAGGSLTVAGGCAIAKDIYIGGASHQYGVSNLYSGDIINIKNDAQNTIFSLWRSTNDIAISRHSPIDGITVSNVITISNTTGSIAVFSTVPSASSSASILTNGGITIMGTSNAVSLTSGGGLTVMGGASITKDIQIGGNATIFSTANSNDVSSGAFVVRGGVGIGGNAHILGDTVVNGNLTVKGTTLSVTSVNTTVKDNILVLNSGPSGSTDAGIMLQRFQQDNDTGAGDVVKDTTRYESFTLPSQTGMASTQVKLPETASASNNYYNEWWIKVSSGFSNNQVRKITSYDGVTRVATISSTWTTQNPALGDQVYIYNKPYVGIVYNEITDRFVFGSTVEDPGQVNVSFTDDIPIQALSILLSSTQNSTSSTVGSIVLNGGISISNTSDAQSATNGGSITTLGGIGVRKSLRVGEGLYIDGTIFKVPVGNTFDKPPSPATGFLYLDTNVNDLQVYVNSQWTSLLSDKVLSSLDGQTKIGTESVAGSNDNIITLTTLNTERMRVTTSGNIGIGTTSPTSLLDVNGTVMVRRTTNAVGVGSGGSLTVLGGASVNRDLFVGGTISSSSDERLKQDIKRITSKDHLLDKIEKLRCVKYKYKDDPELTNHIGFIAQDFADDFPELLRKPEDGYYSLDYTKVTVLLVQCIKDLRKEIKRLKCGLISSLVSDDMLDTSDL
jgi:hypothetical protein